MNLYAYVAGDPVNGIDPTGTQVLALPAIIAPIFQRFDTSREVDDPVTERRLQELDPDVAKKARTMIVNLENFQGASIRITQGYRTYEEQDELYAQGRSKPGKIVTNAKGGESFHNFGVAFDVAPRNKDGSIDWEASTISGGWDTIGEYGKAAGLEWGGDWVSFKDKPHFQDPEGKTLEEYRQENEDQEQ